MVEHQELYCEIKLVSPLSAIPLIHLGGRFNRQMHDSLDEWNYYEDSILHFEWIYFINDSW